MHGGSELGMRTLVVLLGSTTSPFSCPGVFSRAIQHADGSVGGARDAVLPLKLVLACKCRTTGDKRVELLQQYARRFFPATRYLDYALGVERYTLTKAANLVLNVDGCIGALFLDLLHSSSMFSPVRDPGSLFWPPPAPILNCSTALSYLPYCMSSLFLDLLHPSCMLSPVRASLAWAVP